MKRIILLMAAIVCLATSAMAEVTDDQALSPALWQQGVARCAQYTAYDKGFAKGDDYMKGKYPDGYTLEDLNALYGYHQKWAEIYKQFKPFENKGGSINDLKQIVEKPQVWTLVERGFRGFIQDHPELENAPAQAPAAPEQGGEQTQEEKPEGNGGETAGPTVKEESKPGVACPANLPLWLGIIGALLGLWALLTALSNRGKVKEMQRAFARELERTNANLQEFSTDTADRIKALSIRMTGKPSYADDLAVADEAPAEEEPEIVEEEVEPAEDVAEEPAEDAVEAVADEPAEEVAEEADEDIDVEEPAEAAAEEEEVMNLFMSKPDENDDFTRVSNDYEPGNSIYVLTSFDGKRGEFEVIDKPEVHRYALMMPAENLIRACSGNAIQIPSGTRIVTDRAGEAEFIDGKWHVVVKAIIHYEG